MAGKRFSKGNKGLKKAKYSAVKKEDKYQNMAMSKMQKQINLLKSLPERKYFDVSSNYPTILSTPIIFAISKDITAGTSDNTRSGDSVRFTSLNFRFYLPLPIGGTALGTQVRVIIFRWLDNYQNHTPVSTDILAINSVFSPYVIETNQSYRILCDKVFTLSPMRNPDVTFRCNKLLHHSTGKWDSSIILNGPTTGHYWCMIFTDQGAMVNAINGNVYSRIRYVDC